MKLNQNFDFRSICGESVLIPMGERNVDYTNLVHLNETAAYLWKALSDGDRDFEVEDMVSLLLNEYEVSEDVALNDCQALANEWQKNGMLN